MTAVTNPLWSTGIDALSPYVPGEQPVVPGLVKLNTNENPYPPSPAVIEAIRAAAGDDLRLYPDPNGTALRRAIGAMHGLDERHVFLGNGSDEVLAHAFLGLLRHARPILFPDITYSFYPVYCALYGIAYQTVPLDAAFRVDPADYDRPNGGIVLPNPNAPTGCVAQPEQLRTLLERNPGSVVVVDEAYVDFGAETATPLVRQYPNLLVVQTLSKSRSLAGLRVGFAIGDPGLIEALERVKGCFNSYPLDRLALAGAQAALADQAWFESTRRRIVASRESLAERLTDLGFEVLPSKANFLFARHPSHDGATLQQALRERNILVRHFRLPRIDQFVRITVGTEAQCDALVVALLEIVG